MHIQREWVTPVAAGAFLLSAVTGVLLSPTELQERLSKADSNPRPTSRA